MKNLEIANNKNYLSEAMKLIAKKQEMDQRNKFLVQDVQLNGNKF